MRVAWSRAAGWRRYREIASILAQHGFVMVMDSLGLSRHLSIKQRWLRARVPEDDANWAERLGLVLAAMGPTFVKLGQLASLRSDILPLRLVKALEKLQSDVPPFGFDVLVQTLETAWGRPMADVLLYINPEPLAAASLGQVHQGRLLTGQAVVIKVRRPHVVEQTESDLAILKRLGELAERRTEWARQYQVSTLVAELSRTLRQERNFSVEAHYTERAFKQYDGQRGMRIPQVLWEWTRPEVLVLEEVTGTKINEWKSSRLAPSQLAEKFVGALYYQIFVKGFFHADPHPGNIHVNDRGQVIFLDWGLVGNFTPDMRKKSVDLIIGLSFGKSSRVVESLLALGVIEGQVDRHALLQDVDRLRRRYYEVELEQFNLGQALSDILALAQTYQIRIPPEYTLLAKTAVTVDGVVRRLDPHASLVNLGKPHALELLWQRIAPGWWAPDAAETVMEWAEVASRLPSQVDRALSTLSQGEFRIVLEHKNLDKVLQHWERLINRLALTFLLAALVVGTGLVVHRDQLDALTHFPLGEYAFIATLAIGLWVVVGAMRRGKL